MTPEGLEALRRLAEARKSADLAALEKLFGARRACVAEIAATRASRATDLAAPLGATPPEALATRLRWAERRIAELEGRIVALDQRIAAARAAALISLGKDQALGELRDRAAREAARLRLARHERDAPPPQVRREDFE